MSTPNMSPSPVMLQAHPPLFVQLLEQSMQLSPQAQPDRHTRQQPDPVGSLHAVAMGADAAKVSTSSSGTARSLRSMVGLPFLREWGFAHGRVRAGPQG